MIAIVAPDGREATVAGACEGHITHAPRGEHGFGYDPIFGVDQEGCTMAELPPERKNAISHRAAAARAALPLLRQWLAADEKGNRNGEATGLPVEIRYD